MATQTLQFAKVYISVYFSSGFLITESKLLEIKGFKEFLLCLDVIAGLIIWPY